MISDSYPFGMVMPGRSNSSSAYRFGFNGKENDNEVKGTANQQNYGMKIYDPRIGKFLSVDPLTKVYPFYTPNSFAGNKPIWAEDLDGLEENKKTGTSAPPITKPKIPSSLLTSVNNAPTIDPNKVLQVKATLKGKVISGGAEVQIGKLNIKLEGSVGEVSGSVNNQGNFSTGAKVLSGTARTNFGYLNYEEDASLAETNLSINAGGTMDADASIGKVSAKLSTTNNTNVSASATAYSTNNNGPTKSLSISQSSSTGVSSTVQDNGTIKASGNISVVKVSAETNIFEDLKVFNTLMNIIGEGIFKSNTNSAKPENK